MYPDDSAPISASDPSAEELLAEVYEELRKLAAARMAQERSGQTIQATALVHEAWLKLTDGNDQKWRSKAHFFASAAEAMRRILIDRARRKGRRRHGGELKRIDLERVEFAFETAEDVLLDINDSLEKLAEQFPEKAELVKLRFFAGLQLEEAAEVLGVSLATVKRHWVFARAWLYAELTENRG